MIDVQCPDCGRVLIGTRQILAVANGGDGIEMTYVCWCGRLGAERVGRAPLRRRPAAEAEPAGRA
jgi:hypothetical protein